MHPRTSGHPLLLFVIFCSLLVACDRQQEDVEYVPEKIYPEYLTYSQIRLEEYYRCHRQLPDDQVAAELLEEEIQLAQIDGPGFLGLRKLSDTEALLVCTQTQEGLTSGTRFEDFALNNQRKLRDDVAALVRLEVNEGELEPTYHQWKVAP